MLYCINIPAVNSIYLYNVQIHRDIRREVERLPVKCANHKTGCPWTGKLKDHEVRQCSSLWFHNHNFLNLFPPPTNNSKHTNISALTRLRFVPIGVVNVSPLTKCKNIWKQNANSDKFNALIVKHHYMQEIMKYIHYIIQGVCNRNIVTESSI